MDVERKVPETNPNRRREGRRAGLTGDALTIVDHEPSSCLLLLSFPLLCILLRDTLAELG